MHLSVVKEWECHFFTEKAEQRRLNGNQAVLTETCPQSPGTPAPLPSCSNIHAYLFHNISKLGVQYRNKTRQLKDYRGKNLSPDPDLSHLVSLHTVCPSRDGCCINEHSYACTHFIHKESPYVVQQFASSTLCYLLLPLKSRYKEFSHDNILCHYMGIQLVQLVFSSEVYGVLFYL